MYVSDIVKKETKYMYDCSYMHFNKIKRTADESRY